RHGPRVIVACSFLLATSALVAVTLSPPIALMILLVAAAGMGTIGTQVLVYGFVSNYYETGSRAAGVAWCAGFGRLGGILGPVIGGLLVAAGLQAETSFLVFAGVALVGALITLAVPRSPGLVAQVPDTLIGAGPDGRSDGSRERIETPAADLR
ncbi:MAG: MFS transporter, partial [Dietzia cercidiphylli]